MAQQTDHIGETNKMINMAQQTKIDVAIQEIKYKIEIAEREYQSVVTKINTLRDVLDNLDKIKREKLQ